MAAARPRRFSNSSALKEFAHSRLRKFTARFADFLRGRNVPDIPENATLEEPTQTIRRRGDRSRVVGTSESWPERFAAPLVGIRGIHQRRLLARNGTVGDLRRGEAD